MDYANRLILGLTAEMYSVPAREKPTVGMKNYWNLVQKNRKKRRGGSGFIAGPNPNTYMREE
jgi:hypothetical protein